MSVSLDDVRRILDAYIADIHLDADGRSVTVELTGDFQVRAFTYDEKVVVDLMNPSATANDAPLDDEDVEAAADERIRVPVRVGDHPGFSRVVYDWPGAVDYNVTHIGDQVIIRFDRIADFDLANLNASPPKHVYSAETEARGDTARVILVVDPMARLRHFRADLRIVVDALVDPATAETETPAPAPSEPAAPPAKPAEEIVAEAPPDDAASAGEQDPRTPPTAATPTPAPANRRLKRRWPTPRPRPNRRRRAIPRPSPTRRSISHRRPRHRNRTRCRSGIGSRAGGHGAAGIAARHSRRDGGNHRQRQYGG